MKAKLHLRDVPVSGSRVLTRVDFNVPLNDKLEITDDTRIRTALPTVRDIVDRGGKAVLMSHLGRPKGAVVENMRLRPAAARLAELTGSGVTTAPDCVGEATGDLVARMKDGDVLLLENLRFHKGETKNDPEFAAGLARLGDVYVNDAFGTAHRAHASTVGVAGHIETRAMGYLVESELTNLRKATESPERPYVTILGGAKVSDKIGVIENLMPFVDTFLIGGGMAFTFLKAEGREVGDSLLEEDRIETARRILDAARSSGTAILLPEDVVVADNVSEGATHRIVGADGIEPGWKGVDVGPKTVATFADRISGARTIVWNGPLGVFEIDTFAEGTNAVAAAVAEKTGAGAISIIGGGDSAAAVAKAGVAEKMTHISTGGGASLMFLEGKPLPGVEALSDAD
jgi:phosphoglycerate kinase